MTVAYLEDSLPHSNLKNAVVVVVSHLFTCPSRTSEVKTHSQDQVVEV